jgi:hypothetical protein
MKEAFRPSPLLPRTGNCSNCLRDWRGLYVTAHYITLNYADAVGHNKRIYVTKHFEYGPVIVLNICAGSVCMEVTEEETAGRIYARKLNSC